MSEAALVETIRLDIRVHAQEDVSLLAVAPGNYGERFLKEETGLSMENFIKCSNFIGTSFKMLSQEGIHQALLGRACWKTGQSGRWCDEYTFPVW